mmetsp:Transcript_14642/g.43507  ORF Transcript_14642/g.43507 Transcript_14642/m.43507 type:complete len:485 (-) Transcript_14642:295-1749(-)
MPPPSNVPTGLRAPRSLCITQTAAARRARGLRLLCARGAVGGRRRSGRPAVESGLAVSWRGRTQSVGRRLGSADRPPAPRHVEPRAAAARADSQPRVGGGARRQSRRRRRARPSHRCALGGAEEGEALVGDGRRARQVDARLWRLVEHPPCECGELVERVPRVAPPRRPERGRNRLAPRLGEPPLAQLRLQQHLEQHAAKAVHVGRGAVWLARLDLGRHVQIGAAARVAARRTAQPPAREAGAREAEVAELDGGVAARHEDVCRLEVAVQHAAGVHVVQGAAQRGQEGDQLSLEQRQLAAATRHAVDQVPACAVLHRDADGDASRLVPVEKDVLEADDAWVGEALQARRLQQRLVRVVDRGAADLLEDDGLAVAQRQGGLAEAALAEGAPLLDAPLAPVAFARLLLWGAAARALPERATKRDAADDEGAARHVEGHHCSLAHFNRHDPPRLVMSHKKVARRGARDLDRGRRRRRRGRHRRVRRV